MLTVSNAAKALLKTINKPESDEFVRLERHEDAAAQDAMQLRYDQPRTEDEVFTEAGEPVLVVDKTVADSLDGRKLDVHQGEEGARLVVVPEANDSTT